MSSTTVLALNSTEEGLERLKLNASKALTVDGSFYPATQPISAAVALTVDGSAVTQPVSGSVSITGSVATTGGTLSVANNALWTSQSIADLATAVTTGLDISLYRSVIIYGDTDNTGGEIMIQISFDNTNWYDIGSNLYPDGMTGNFVSQISSDAKYIRLSRENNSGVTETISAAIMIKSD